MVNATEDRSLEKTPRVGQPAEQHRTSQENAGSTEGGGTRNAVEPAEQLTKGRGISRERNVGARSSDGEEPSGERG
jgi:hypothetical protein